MNTGAFFIQRRWRPATGNRRRLSSAEFPARQCKSGTGARFRRRRRTCCSSCPPEPTAAIDDDFGVLGQAGQLAGFGNGVGQVADFIDQFELQRFICDKNAGRGDFSQCVGSGFRCFSTRPANRFPNRSTVSCISAFSSSLDSRNGVPMSLFLPYLLISTPRPIFSRSP